MNNQKGFLKLLVAAFVFLLVGAFLITILLSNDKDSPTIDDQPTLVLEELPEDSNVPSVINNDAIGELDALFEDIDSTNESLNDLEL